MFGIGMTELMVIFVVALLVLGPKRLPEMARSLGRALGEFRRASSDLRQQFLDVADEARIGPLDGSARSPQSGAASPAATEDGDPGAATAGESVAAPTASPAPAEKDPEPRGG